jgi:hypothetical protein
VSGLCALFLSMAVASVVLAVPQQHVLLVGVTQYPYLPRDYWLNGPGNDVALLREVLITRFHVAPEHVTVLVGWPREEALRPTRANIARAFQHLAEVAGPEDQVVIFLAGHGSQQPANDDPDNFEPDGLDEIFLAADVRGWNRTTGQVENAIVDDEIHAWVTAIRAKGAFVWVIVDACHAGTMLRGAPRDEERERSIPPEVLMIPAEALTAATQRAMQRGQSRGAPSAPAGVLGLPTTQGGVVATYAAQESEPTPEKKFPSEAGAWHGLFTHTLSEVLLQSASALTYRELVERVHARYRQAGRYQPTPLVEGGGLDREVLGLQVWPERPKILLKGPGDTQHTWLVDAGSLHGIRSGSVLAVYPPAGLPDADRPIGHVRVLEARPQEALVEPIAFDNVPAPAEAALVRRARCQVVLVDYGDLRLRVAVQVQTEPAAEVQTMVPGTGPRSLEEALTVLTTRPDRLIERVANPADAAWYVRVVSDQVYLVPAAGWLTSRRQPPGEEDTPVMAPPQFALGPVTASENLRTTVQQALIRIARAQHLLSLTTEDGVLTSPSEAIDVGIDVLRFPDQETGQGEVVPYDTEGRRLYPGDVVAFRVTNRTTAAVDVTLLFINSSYGIHTLFPSSPDEPNRLGPGQQRNTVRFTVAPPYGTDHVVAIAIKAQPGTSPLDFSYLEQPELSQVQSTTRGAQARQSPLGRLLEHALYGVGSTRGARDTDLSTYAVRVLSWQTAPAASKE